MASEVAFQAEVSSHYKELDRLVSDLVQDIRTLSAALDKLDLIPPAYVVKEEMLAKEDLVPKPNGIHPEMYAAIQKVEEEPKAPKFPRKEASPVEAPKEMNGTKANPSRVKKKYGY